MNIMPLRASCKLLILLVLSILASPILANECEAEMGGASDERPVNAMLEDELKIARASERILAGLLAPSDDPSHYEFRDFVARLARGLSQTSQRDTTVFESNFDQLLNSRVLLGLLNRDLINSVSIHYGLPITWTYTIYQEAKPLEVFEVISIRRIAEKQYQLERRRNGDLIGSPQPLSSEGLMHNLVPALDWSNIKVNLSTLDRQKWLCEPAKLAGPFRDTNVVGLSIAFGQN